MEIDFKSIDLYVNIVANLTTIIAYITASVLFFINRDKISSAFSLIINYTKQITLTELKFRLEKLNDFNVNNVDHKEQVINLLHEIEGQINGNKFLKLELAEQLKKINNFISQKTPLTEPKKRSLVSELRESLRDIDVSMHKKI